jgi:hypothetical protein
MREREEEMQWIGLEQFELDLGLMSHRFVEVAILTVTRGKTRAMTKFAYRFTASFDYVVL